MFSTHVRIFVGVDRVDLRVSFDRLAGIVRERFGEDPRGGALFVFLNKGTDRCKVLFYDRSGYAILYKRLDRSVFVPPPRTEGASRVEMRPEAFARFLERLAVEGKKKNTNVHCFYIIRLARRRSRYRCARCECRVAPRRLR
ncbi:IS66 family insertion sequence element accessory protein TnpB [Pendulispora brunnea]|uniref:IS66 family insertion sequence element accessory protein TnpB n=1 Tax=Pendulispora brunnea TaxID=2905690 RepID=UPI00374E1145